MTRISWPPVIEEAARIVRGYDTSVTLRQLFYRLVASGAIPNTQSAYGTLSRLTAQARRDECFPALMDATRRIVRPYCNADATDAVQDALERFRLDRTLGQETTVYLGTEKRTMIEQLRSWFGGYGLPILPLGGYHSEPFERDIAVDARRYGREAILLYVGDFDPSGEDILRNLTKHVHFDEVVRVALTRDQVEQYALPVMLGKATDTRASGFVKRHGQLVQVELEAMDVDDLRALCSAALSRYWNADAYTSVMAAEKSERAKLRELVELAA